MEPAEGEPPEECCAVAAEVACGEDAEGGCWADGG